jgi:hypothetical protein
MTSTKITGLFLLVLAFVSVQAQIFGPAKRISTTGNPQVVKSADFNSDGYDDIVYSALSGNQIAVALFNPGTGNFDEAQVVSTAFPYAVSLFPADLDGDNFVDFLTVSQLNHKVAWFKNDGTGNFTLQPLISSTAQGAISVIATDIDGDGDNDVVAAAKDDNMILWYENTDGNGNFSDGNIITDEGEFPVVIISADIDNDNDPDIVAGKLAGNKVVWYANYGSGSFGEEQVITTEISFISALFAADINGDDFIDIVSASRNDSKIAWYENTGGGTFSAQQIVSGEMPLAFDVVAADFDLDNDMDLVASAMGGNEIRVFNNEDGMGAFVPANLISNVCESPKGLATGDFDDDGDMDILATHSQQDPDEVVWYENGAATFEVHVINKVRDVWRVALQDINNDGNTDIFYSDGQDVCWIANQDSAQSFGSETILWQGYNIFEIAFNDIDSDGDPDLFIADAMGDRMLWLENTDGNGSFSGEITIDDSGDGPADIDFSDVDGDGDDDLLVFFVNESTIALYKNTDGQGDFEKSIVTSVAQYSGCFIDIDNDNDDDITFSAYEEILYLENDGSGNFSVPQAISDFGYAWKMLPAHMNDDDYADLVYAPDYNLHWLGNNQNLTFDDFHVDMWGSVNDFALADPDNDGDTDVLAACRTVGLVNFAENINQGDSLVITLPFLVYDANALATGDLNNDGWIDAAVGSWPTEGLYWAENYQFRILANPIDQYVLQGEDAYFSVVSAGVEIYQWQENAGSGFVDIGDDDVYSGTEKAQLHIHNVSADLFNNQYRCRVFDKSGIELITNAAVLYNDYLSIPKQSSVQDKVIFYPNPATDIVNLVPGVEIKNVVIRDVSGKIYYESMETENHELEVSDFNNGIYIIRIQTENGVVTGKIIKD